MSALEITGLRVRHARSASDVLHDVSLHVARGECVAVVGASGSGKSTLARAVLGLAPAGASVEAVTHRIDGVDARDGSERVWNRVRGQRVGFVLQDALVSLDPLRTIRDELLSALDAQRRVPRVERDRTAAAILRRVHAPELIDRLGSRAHELSGGQRQRVLIGAAIAAEPAVLVADEPTSSLDRAARDGVLALLAEWRDAGGSVLLVTHDLEAARDTSDRIVVLDDGRIVEQGTPEQVWTAPRSLAARMLVAATSAPPRVTAAPRSDLAPAVLAFDRVEFGYRSGAELRDLTFALHRGESLGIIGASGAGKSTIARLALGFAAPQAGSISVTSHAWSALRERERRPLRGAIQLVHQDGFGAFDPRFSVRRILDEAWDLRGLARSARDARARALLGQVALPEHVLDRRASQLSGGQRQRVAIARALAVQPEVLVCDESVSALDTVTQAAILRLLREVQERTGVALLFISHDHRAVETLCSRVLELRDGTLYPTPHRKGHS